MSPTKTKTQPEPDQSDRLRIQEEIERRAAGQRLTPAQRRIAQCMVEHGSELGFLSSMELAQLANVSQPSVTRFAMALGFDGYIEMRKLLRSRSGQQTSSSDVLPNAGLGAHGNRYQAAAASEAGNLADFSSVLGDEELIDLVGTALSGSKPLAVLGLRASAGLAVQFSYFASKVHPDIRLLANGGSLIEDQVEQCRAAGGDTLLAFMMPLYPRETVNAIILARQIGMKVILIADSGFSKSALPVDILLQPRISSRLVFDSYAAASMLVTVLLDAMSSKMNGQAQKRLDTIDKSSKRRKVFIT